MDYTWYNGKKSNKCFHQQKIILKEVKSMQGPNCDTYHILATVKQKQKITKISQNWNKEKLNNPGFTKE